MHEPVEWSEDQCPTSPRFGDVYRSRVGGWQQAQTVFVGGCHLPQRWQNTEHFTILETGFGLGLNFLATWATWLADARRCARLHYVAVEAYPVSAADVVRSAQALSDTQAISPLVDLARELALHWQTLRPGMQQFSLAQGAILLTLAIGDVLPMLQQLDCRADAVYLDGFSPARNPQMWSDETLRAVAARCIAGTTLASFSVASSVRSGLRQAGFSVRRKPGVAPKWHRLEASYNGLTAP
ncbi:tRNA (5-methylaminomethyl-2-thiouridine)(34)-methyltransferase MnmD [Rhodoferax sp. GW822-FHT02A01]|uniref:tRNA (5-methylaminomethyl-2-thiouridine)(34)-methyltransferase MnmD n=1 Tax=Rhodoferax sp. GW822-FHT02A01 TaxID=3141537 RepID=UPI00315D6286